MTDRPGADGATEFTTDWSQFEVRLAHLFGELAKPGVAGDLVLYYPTGEEMLREVNISSATSEASGDGTSPTNNLREAGVNVLLPEGPVTFYALEVGSEVIGEAALAVCVYLRSEAFVAHPSLLTADADGAGADLLDQLCLPGPGGVLREARPPVQRKGKRQIVRRNDTDSVTESETRGAEEDGWPGISWPLSVDEIRDVVEEVLSPMFGSVRIDDDGDYVINTSEAGGPRFYVTVLNDEPFLAFRKAVVLHVNSRRSAVIEANYLNRANTEIRWVLRGHMLYQECFFSVAPFVPVRFAEVVERFSSAYRDTESALRLRLGDE